MEDPDKQLFDKTKICVAKNRTEDDFADELEKLKQRNICLGCIEKNNLKIKLLSKDYITSKPFSIPNALYNEFKAEIKRLLNLKVIQPSKSSYESPCFAVKKKDGSLRLLISYRKLNAVTVKDNFLFPTILDNINTLKDSKYFSKIDMKCVTTNSR